MADPNGSFMRLLGLELESGAGPKCQRFAAIVEDGILLKLVSGWCDDHRHPALQRCGCGCRKSLAWSPSVNNSCELLACTPSSCIQRPPPLATQTVRTDLACGAVRRCLAFPDRWCSQATAFAVGVLGHDPARVVDAARLFEFQRLRVGRFRSDTDLCGNAINM